MSSLKICVAFLFVFITLTTSEECFDRAVNCAYMTGFCSWRSFGPYYCKKTCGFCSGKPTTKKPPPSTRPTRPPTKRPPVTSECGKVYVQTGRVIAGDDAVPHSWPWQVLMLRSDFPSCGGTIISPRWIVTAAHCVDRNKGTYNYKIRTGEHDMRRVTGREKNYYVDKIKIHPDWNSRSIRNDIALIKVTEPIKFNQYVGPACLPEKTAPVGKECYITGWGKIQHPGQMHSELQQAKMPVVDSTTCQRKNYPYTRIQITAGMICGGHGGAKRISGCHGDSGGPFVCNTNGRWEIQGAVSHGSGDCDADKTYTVYSRISYYKQWIEETMKYN